MKILSLKDRLSKDNIRMKIYEGYINKTLRSHFKDYIEAEGHSVMKRDKIHYRFGVYISRLKGVRYDVLLTEAETENEFREKLEMIFYEKWVNNIGYPEIPPYFFIYLDYLRTQCALQDDLQIDGLELNFDDYIPQSGGLTKFEERFLTADNKLRLMANPTLITQLKEKGLWSQPISDECIDFCLKFYKETGLNMQPADWEFLLKKSVGKKANKSQRGATSIEIIDKNGFRKVLNVNRAYEYVIELAGIEKVINCRLLNHGYPIVLKKIPTKGTTNYKELGEGLYLNCLGSATDRFKTLRALVSVCRLPLELNLVGEKSAHSPKRILKKKQDDAIQNNDDGMASSEISPAAHIKSMPAIPTVENDPSFEFGKDGVLNLFDEF